MSNYSIIQPQNSISEYQPLPEEVILPEELGYGACPWLDEYKIFGKKWSPRSYEGYHEILGISALSIVAARRILFYFGKERYTSIYSGLAGRSSLPAKTTASNVMVATLKSAGFDSLFIPNDCTPQKMVNEMTIDLPSNYEKLSQDKQDALKLKFAFIGQRGWTYDEFGKLLSQMMKPNGPMMDFRGILRVFDDGNDNYKYATISRGVEIIENPYLTLVSILTLTDIAPFGKRGSGLWGDGFLARFIFVLPELDFFQNGRFPNERRIIPSNLTLPLRNFHEWLGIPEVTIKNGDVSVTPIIPKIMEIKEDVYNAVYEYDDALRSIVAKFKEFDLDGNYTRLPEKALRIAALFAGFQQKDCIEMTHWAKAQNIAENFRKDLHKLVHQIDIVSQVDLNYENKIKEIIEKKGNPTVREINQQSKISYPEIENSLDRLIQKNEIRKINSNHTIRYELNF